MLTVRGIPRPQPRPRLARGRVVSTQDPKARTWSDAIVRAAHGWEIHGSARVTLWFRFPTKDARRWGKAHLHVPDADNLAKLALDALQRAGTLANDSAVFDLRAVKIWGKPEQAGMVALLEETQATPPPGEDQVPVWIAQDRPGPGDAPAGGVLP